MMMSAKKIARLAKKWQRMAAQGRKRLALGAAAKEVDEDHAALRRGGHGVLHVFCSGEEPLPS
uniref:Putative small auxin up RNA n=1 Tax=Zea mays TaxID=4577 RepID=Q70SW5_MAIZE|nr:putative small auxin up RNA [Zea mays]